MYFSPSLNSFFPKELLAQYRRAETWPEDAIEVTQEEWLIYGSGPAPLGHRRGADHKGRPTWIRIPPETLDVLTARKSREIETARDNAFAEGLPYDIAGEPDIVQTRPEDKTNLLAIAMEARALAEDGVTSPVIEFRGLSNVNHSLTPQQAIDLTDAALTHFKMIYKRSWNRKDTLDLIIDDDSLSEKAKLTAIERVEW